MKSIIIYTTKHGYVEITVQVLESKMDGQVTSVNIMKENPPSLEEYDNVILGGSIYMGRIQKKMSDYISKNLPQLMSKRIGLFICAGSPDPKARVKELESAYPAELYNHAVTKEVFGYEINFEKLGFFEKLVMKAVTGDKSNISELCEDNIANFAKAMC